MKRFIFLFGFCGVLLFFGCTPSGDPLPNPDGTLNENAGFSVAISGSALLSGVARSDVGNFNAGKALMYRKTGALWNLESTLLSTIPTSDGGFGWSVDVEGDRAIVGAFGERASTGSFRSGAAYIFEWNGTAWNLATRLTAQPNLQENGFGAAVALSGEFAAVGAPFGPPPTFVGPGVVYMFRRDTSTGMWEQEAILTSSDGSDADEFGTSVSLNGDFLLVGADHDDDYGSASGSAYMFHLQAGSWVQQTKLTAFDAQAGDHFGYAVSLAEKFAIVGAPDQDTKGMDGGAAYLFERDLMTDEWSPSAQLLASDGSASDQFGKTVAADGEALIVGAWLADGSPGVASGAAYVYRRGGGGGWLLATKLTRPTGVYGDGFGASVGISGSCAAVGAVNQDTAAGTDSGATYVFCNLPGIPFPEIEIDVICCVQPPDPGGPVESTLRFTSRGTRKIVERWAEMEAPNGETRALLEPKRVVVGRTQEERIRLKFSSKDPSGKYKLRAYVRDELGNVLVRTVNVTH